MVSTELLLVLFALFAVAFLYSSVGLGGGSGYLAVLSMTSFASSNTIWLKQYAWSLNLIVAGMAFWYFQKSGHHDRGLSAPFVAASVPMAAIGGFFLVEGAIYDVLLSITLAVAAWRLVSSDLAEIEVFRPRTGTAIVVGGVIGLASGVIGIGGGIFLLPALVLGRWASAKEAAATASIFVWLNSLSGLIGASAAGRIEVDLSLLLPFGSVVMIGGLFGSRFGSRVSSQRGVKELLVVILMIAAFKRLSELLL